MPVYGYLIFLALFCGGLLFIMYRVIGSQATQATDHLMDLNRDYEKKKEELLKMQEETRQQTQQLLDAARQDAEKIRQEATEEIAARQHQAMEEARGEAERVVANANENRQALRQEILQELKSKSAGEALKLFLHVLPEPVRLAAHHYWVKALLDGGLSEVHAMKSHESFTSVHITTAFALDEDERRALNAALEKALGQPYPLEETVDAGLVAGLTLKLGHKILEGSLIAKLREAALHASKLA